MAGPPEYPASCHLSDDPALEKNKPQGNVIYSVPMVTCSVCRNSPFPWFKHFKWVLISLSFKLQICRWFESFLILQTVSIHAVDIKYMSATRWKRKSFDCASVDNVSALSWKWKCCKRSFHEVIRRCRRLLLCGGSDDVIKVFTIILFSHKSTSELSAHVLTFCSSFSSSADDVVTVSNLN